jgi:hypothetical protein
LWCPTVLSFSNFTGPGIPLPTPYEIYNTYLRANVASIKKYIDQQREVWKEYGCTIMSDGWTGPTRLSIINVMVYSAGKTVFLKSVDASDEIKNYLYIYKILSPMVKEFGEHNVVQIITDNGSAYKKAGMKLARRYNLYWTPCAVHCIDLMLEDVGKRANVAEVLKNCREVMKFIYNHVVLLSKMREEGQGKLIRPGPTRFATNYLALTSLMSIRPGLKKMFTSDWWDRCSFRQTTAGQFVE